MTIGFNATSLEKSYSVLDFCPERFLHEAVTLPLGTLAERVQGIRCWREALLAGSLPLSDSWPSEGIAAPVRRALSEMGLVRFCKGQDELVDALLKDILASFVHQSEQFQFEIAERMRELEELERLRLRKTEESDRGHKKRPKKTKRPLLLHKETLQRLHEQAAIEVAQRERGPDSRLLSSWGEKARIWAEITGVFGDLGEMLGRGWDMALGVLHHVGWFKLLRLQKLLEQIPQIREIVQLLGRLHASENTTSVAVKILAPTRRLEEERKNVPTPLVPAETRGVERSGEISRMLPVEATMLGHSKLRLLWHARRAERALLTYRVEGMETESVWTEKEVMEEIEGQRPRPERGPILAVIDTSGSMNGLPEQVAKALVLEVMRTAHAEKRKCYLYAFSGPGQVCEHELDLSSQGIGRLLAFLSQSFGGGTDIEVVSAVVDHLAQAEWKNADVILVSDGEWRAPKDIIVSVQRSQEKGTRFHGVQVGNLGRTGLHGICDPVHLFSDWAALAGWNNRRSGP